MKTTRLPAQRSGLRISVQFESHSHCATVFWPERSDVVPNQITKYADGDTHGYIYSRFGLVRAFAAWLTPCCDSIEIRRAQWSSHNPDTGEIEADVYPEYMADVLLKIARLKPRSLSVHSVSL